MRNINNVIVGNINNKYVEQLMDRERKETLNATVDPDIFQNIEKERGIIKRATWLNNFLEIFLSSDNQMALKINQYRRTHGNPPLRETIEKLLDSALDSKRKQRD